MALKDVYNYYKEIEAQYFEMLQDVKDFDEALEEHIIDEEHYNQAQSIINKLKENYERVSYIVYLIGSPRRKPKKKKYNTQNKTYLEYLNNQKASLDDIKGENKDILKDFKKYAKEMIERYK